MVITIEALFDGKTFRPVEAVPLEPNSRVKLIVQTFPLVQENKPSFLEAAANLNLEGPSDWAENLEEYLYPTETAHDH